MHFFKFFTAATLAAALLSGCPETASCGEGQQYSADRRECESADAAARDGSSTDADATDFCDSCAEDEICDRENAECDECDPSVMPSTCPEPTPVCTATGACVACFDDSDCESPTASHCEANTCVRCSGGFECGHVVVDGTDLSVCDLARDGGECVECTEANEIIECADAGTNVGCDRTVGRCAPVPRTKQTCEECEHDYECVRGRRCVEMTFGDPAVALGSFCLLEETKASPCTNPANYPYAYGTPATSVDGADGTFCFPLQGTGPGMTITCAAINDYNRVSCTTDAGCGADGQTDGYCAPADPPGDPRWCSYRCFGTRDCPEDVTCTTGGESHCAIP